MRTVYSQLRAEDVGNLKNHFKKFFEGKEVVNFILNELNARRDSVLVDDRLNSDQKVGALIHLRELVDFFNGGIAFNIQDIINKSLKDEEAKNLKQFKKNKHKKEFSKIYNK
jgi:hypothetical protein